MEIWKKFQRIQRIHPAANTYTGACRSALTASHSPAHFEPDMHGTTPQLYPNSPPAVPLAVPGEEQLDGRTDTAGPHPRGSSHGLASLQQLEKPRGKNPSSGKVQPR